MKMNEFFDELLMVPGPSQISNRVIQAMVRPAIAHYDPIFFKIFDECCESLKKIFQTKNSDVIILPGTGRISLESAIASVIEPGDEVLNIVDGLFSEWISEMIKTYRGKPIDLKFEWGKPINLEKIKEKLEENNRIKMVTVVHSESSTGALHPIKEIGKIVNKYDKLYFVDAISSLGAIDIKTDEWGIDFCCAASQKCLSAPIGLAILSISEKAWDYMKNRREPPYTFSLNLIKWKQNFIRKPVPRPYPEYPSTHLVYALHEAINIILEEGLENVFKRHKIVGEAVRAGIKAIGLKLFPEESIASDTVTVIRTPNNINVEEILRIMRDKHHVFITGAPPSPHLRGKVFRIGHMGLNASPIYIIPTLSALEETLKELGLNFDFGIGIETARKILYR